ncbi:uncharacterized protein [Macaca nemestrina]|uniref:uncharacterized protein isoform X5 n=1 Tax=Macaca nemestrina TaxID=9545 RepID=UPI0039B9B98C
MLRSSGLKLSQKYFVTRRIKTFMGCLNIFIIDLHQELLKDFSSSFKCNLAATTTCDKLQNTEYRILEATVSRWTQKIKELSQGHITDLFSP